MNSNEENEWEDVPENNNAIVRRNINLPPLCKLLKLGEGIRAFRDVSGVEVKLLELCGRKGRLTPKDLDVALNEIKKVGESGIPLQKENRFLRWIKFPDERMNNLFVMRKEGTSVHYIGVCSIEGCFQPTPNPIDNRPLRCHLHKGKLTRFTLIRFENKQGMKMKVELKSLEYRYSEETEQQDFDWAMRCRFKSLKPTEVEIFDSEDAFDKRYAVCGTAWMLISLVDKTVEYSQVTALAHGLEGQVKDEIESHGWSLKILKEKAKVNKRSFQFQQKPPCPNSEIEDILYTMFNEEYQKVSKDGDKLMKEAVTSPSLYFQMAIVGEFPRSKMWEVENCYVVALFIAYLFNLTNPFNFNDPHTRPHVLNRDVNCSHFTDRSWTTILDVLKEKYGVEMDLVPHQKDNLQDLIMEDADHKFNEGSELVFNNIEPSQTSASKETISILGKRRNNIEKCDRKIKTRKVLQDSETQFDDDQTQFFPAKEQDTITSPSVYMSVCEGQEISGRACTSVTQIQAVAEMKHGQPCSAKCELCNKEFECAESLGFHIKVQHLTCNICGGSVFSSVSNLMMHLEQHRKKHLFCPAAKCYKPFKCVPSWRLHYLANHGREIPAMGEISQKCYFCDMEFQDVNGWNDHVPSHYFTQTLDRNVQIEQSNVLYEKIFQDLMTDGCNRT